MPEITFPVRAVWRTLENGHVLGEALHFPDLTRLARARERLDARLMRNLAARLPTIGPAELHRLVAAGDVTVASATVSLDPPPKFPSWRGELPLEFPVLRWQHGNDAYLAYVPALALEVVANKSGELDAILPKEILSALYRCKASASLSQLAEMLRPVKTEVALLHVTVDLPTPKRRVIDAEKQHEKKKTVLNVVATNLVKATLARAYQIDDLVCGLAEALAGRSPRSVLLVGPSGVGKTAAFHQLVRERKERNLGSTPFFATSGAKLVAGQCGYGMWQQRCRDVCREASKRRAVLHLGNLVELMDVGKSEGNPSGVATFLRPAIARGEILAVAECTPEQLPLIEREDPLLADAFHHLVVSEPDAAAVRTILQLFAYDQPAVERQALSTDVLDTIDRLHRRYATYSASPGRPLRFLQNLLNDHAAKAVVAPRPRRRKHKRKRPGRIRLGKPQPTPMPITSAGVLTAFTRETGLPRFLLDSAEPLDLCETQRWFAARVIGQPEAIDLVVDLIGTVKAGLTPPQKPIASLMFVGPTGVGKTEMAKSLAEYLFGSPQRLTRFDMSEYHDPVAVQRLVGTAFGAEGQLTAKVREQPFSVLLLDEFEKAHPQFFDLLLQMLGEGRLTDGAGRLADFRNCVVILTSNLGAESFQQGQYGFPSSPLAAWRAESRDHFTREVQAFLRPELFNRLDRVVAFAPLDEATVLSIARRQLALLQERDGVRYRGVHLTIDDAVAAHLARVGYEPRYGARPLKRALERQLLAPLAERVNGYSTQTALTASVALVEGTLNVVVRPRLDDRGRLVAAATALPQAAGIAHRATEQRRLFQRIEKCSAVTAMHNDLFQLERLEKQWLERLAKRRKPDAEPPKNPLGPVEQARLAWLRAFLTELASNARRIRAVEEESLLTLYGGSDLDAEKKLQLDLFDQEHAMLAGAARDAMLELYCRRFDRPHEATLAFFSESKVELFELAAAYRELAGRWGYASELWRYLRPDGSVRLTDAEKQIRRIFERAGNFWHKDVLFDAVTFVPLLKRTVVARPERYLRKVDGEPVGLGLGLKGQAAFVRFGPEDGLHVIRSALATAKVLVQTAAMTPGRYVPPDGVARRGFVGSQPVRRTFDAVQSTVSDVETVAWPERKFAARIEYFIEEKLRQNLEDMLED